MRNIEYSVQMNNISKSFGGIKALDDVSLNLKKGEVLALVGDNGAGKSTLIKVLTGDITKDSGDILINNKNVTINHPNDSIKLGIEAIYQDLALVGNFDLASNLFLGRELVTKRIGFPILNKSLMIKEAHKIMKDRLGYDIRNVHEPTLFLSGGQQQAVAIGRMIISNAKILIMDEPFASLGAEGSKNLINMIDKLKKQEISIIIISHNLEHIFSVADRILVLRLGKRVGLLEKCNTDKTKIVSLIVGGT